jgi:hypothetical protein
MWWMGPVVIFASRLLYMTARDSRASRSGSVLFFRVSLALRILFGFAISVLCYYFIKDFNHEQGWLIALAAVVIILLCLAWPGTITVDPAGVSSQVWWRGRRTMPWEAGVGLDKDAEGNMEVIRSDGRSIGFSRYHVDPGRFEAEVLRRAKLRRPSKPGVPLSINFTGR